MEHETHECLYKNEIQSHSIDITELQTEVQFKKEKIDQIIQKQTKMDDKIDKIIETINNMEKKSITGDNDLKNRVTSIESELRTVRWMLGITATVLGVAIAILSFILTNI